MTTAPRLPFDIDLSVTLAAPYVVHGVDSGRHGLDVTLLRNHRQHLVLPGTLLAGRICECWFTLMHDPANQAHNKLGILNPDEWFGAGGMVGQPGARRARIQVSDLEGPPCQVAPEHDITRLHQDDATGAGVPGHLMLIEQQHPPGAPIKFDGCWRVWATQAEVDALCTHMSGALRMQTQLGAYRSIGFGRLVNLSITAQQRGSQPLALKLLDETASLQRFALSSDEPLCVGTRSRRGNVFESDDIITGGTLKACLATLLTERAAVARVADVQGLELAAQFDALRITHAMPTQLGQKNRATPAPASLVCCAEVIADAWPHGTPPPIDQLPGGKAVAFQTDWKSEQHRQANKTRSWGRLHRHLRIRTDISADGRAKDGALFAYETVVSPPVTDTEPGTHWLFDIDLGGIEATRRNAVWAGLVELLKHGLGPLGKTDALATLQALPRPLAELPHVHPGDQVPLMLVTDSLLFATDCVADKDAIDLLALYSAAFADLPVPQGLAPFNQAFVLKHFFASQRLEGGEYLYRRFQLGSGRASAPYQPYVLTQAGSVFVFQVLNADAANALLAHWCNHGLGLPKQLADSNAYGSQWHSHPYLRENGFGEVMLSKGLWPELKLLDRTKGTP